jgi:hypothetical protein
MKTLFVAALVVVSVPSAFARQVTSRSDRLPISRPIFRAQGGLAAVYNPPVVSTSDARRFP